MAPLARQQAGGRAARRTRAEDRAGPGADAAGAALTIVEAAPAKLNLWLHVLGRRADGYHLVDSLVAFAELGDTLAVERADATSLAIDGEFAPVLDAGEGNLVLRAARAFADASGQSSSVAFRLTKNLPVAAGIGGGSADAAAALRALARMSHVPVATLAAPASALGADVPACLASRAVYAGGAGEIVEPAPRLPEVGVVLVNPRVPLPTPAVFAARAGAFSQPAPLAAAPADAARLAALLAERRNDLTPGAVALVPAIADCLAALERSAGCLVVRMSGSGATCFGLYADGQRAAAAAAAIARAEPGWWVVATRLADA